MTSSEPKHATRSEIVSVAKQNRAANFRSASFDAEENTIDIIFTTGADYLRNDACLGEYIERLATGPENVRLDRLNAGAPFLDSHSSYGLGSVIGSIVPQSARMDGGQGLASIQLSNSSRAADSVQDIRDGVIRNVSVGYIVHAYTRIDSTDGQPPVLLATDWEPIEASAVTIPADAGAQIVQGRAGGIELNTAIITRALSADHQEAIVAEETIETNEDIKLEPAVTETDVVASATEVVAARGYSEADLARMLSEARSKAETDERARQCEIRSLGTNIEGMSELAEAHCRSGKSLQTFKDAILEKLAARSATTERLNTSIAEPSLKPATNNLDWEFARAHFGTKK